MALNMMSIVPVVGTGGVTAGAVCYTSSSTTVICDADSSQAATAALKPTGVCTVSAAAGEYTQLAGENAQGVTYIAGTGGVAVGDLLVCEDGGAGAVITYASSDYSDGDDVYVLGRAHSAAAAGAQFRGSFRPYLTTPSNPA
jgi:hypothetical protein